MNPDGTTRAKGKLQIAVRERKLYHRPYFRHLCGRPHIAAAMPPALFTLGYEKRSLEEYIELLRGAGVDVLIDVRETAWSHKPGFSKSTLAAALGRARIEYVHARFAGNPKWLRSAAQDHEQCLVLYSWYLDEHAAIMTQMRELVRQHLLAGKSVCLTCFERHPDDCHRGILATRLARGAVPPPEHLATEGTRRLIS